MADTAQRRRSSGDNRGEAAGAADRESTLDTPRWVKVFGIIALVILLLFIVLMFIRGRDGRRHTPLRHVDGYAAPESGHR